MARVTLVSDLYTDEFEDVKNIEMVIERFMQYIVPIYGELDFKHFFTIILNNNKVYEHNTPLFDGDVVKIIQRGLMIQYD